MYQITLSGSSSLVRAPRVSSACIKPLLKCPVELPSIRAEDRGYVCVFQGVSRQRSSPSNNHFILIVTQ